MKSTAAKVLVLVTAFACASALVWSLTANQVESPAELGYDAALAKIRSQDVLEATISWDSVRLVGNDGKRYFTKLDGSDALRTTLLNAIDEVNKARPNSIKTVMEQPSVNVGMMLLLNWFPLLLLAGVAAVSFYLGRVSWRH